MVFAVFLRKNAEILLEGRCKLALALIADGSRDLGHRLVGLPQQLRGPRHAMLLHVRGKRRSVDRFEDLLERRRVHQILM